jgi:zinc finger protein
VKFYERTREQQAALGFLAEPEQPVEAVLPASAVGSNSGGLQAEPHGAVGALAGRRAIAQGNPDEVAAALCRYAAPEEVLLPSCCHQSHQEPCLFVPYKFHWIG